MKKCKNEIIASKFIFALFSTDILQNAKWQLVLHNLIWWTVLIHMSISNKSCANVILFDWQYLHTLKTFVQFFVFEPAWFWFALIVIVSFWQFCLCFLVLFHMHKLISFHPFHFAFFCHLIESPTVNNPSTITSTLVWTTTQLILGVVISGESLRELLKQSHWIFICISFLWSLRGHSSNPSW